MNLDQAQREKVAAWIAQGMKLSEIQGRLASEFGQRLTYMEVRLLVDDLKLTPKDSQPAKPADSTSLATPSQAANPPSPAATTGSGSVSVTVDQLARPGALVSGKVSFSDGQQARINQELDARAHSHCDTLDHRPNEYLGQ